MLQKTLIVVLTAYSLPLFAEISMDPRLRDEDISGTALKVDISQRADGLYSYKYQLTSSAENKGRVNAFLVDLSCDKTFDEVILPTPTRPDFGGNHAPVGSVTPTANLGASSGVDVYGISRNGFAMFGLALDPGETVRELELVSPAEPGMRYYQLKPWMDNGPEWAYPEEPDPTIPWIPHFTVTGAVAGPGCPGVTTTPAFSRFPGTFRNETEEANQLLTYSGTDKDRWHADSKTTEFSFTIHYSGSVDTKTFKVEPGWAKRLFNPAPGTSEIVSLPLKKGKNMYHFEALALEHVKGGKPETLGSQSKDRDVFEIRVDVQ